MNAFEEAAAQLNRPDEICASGVERAEQRPLERRYIGGTLKTASLCTFRYHSC
jgi:hypothetical protein